MKNKYILPVSIVCILAYDKIVVFECLVEGFLTNTILQQLQFSLSLSLSLSVYWSSSLCLCRRTWVYSPKISLVCDEHHHPGQTKGTAISQKILFYIFTPSCLSERYIS